MTTPTPLDPRSLAHRLTTVGHALHHRLFAQLRDSGIHPQTAMVLRAIDGRVDAPWITERIARGGKRLAALADRGWIERSDDGWALTAGGREILDGLDADRAELLAGIPAEDVARLSAALDTLADALGLDDAEERGFGPFGGGFGPFVRDLDRGPVDGHGGDRPFGLGKRGGFGPGTRGGFGPGAHGFGAGARGFGAGARGFGLGMRGGHGGFGPGARGFGPGAHGFGASARGFGAGARGFGADPRQGFEPDDRAHDGDRAHWNPDDRAHDCGHADGGHAPHGRDFGPRYPRRPHDHRGGGRGAQQAYERGFDAGFRQGRESSASE